MLFLRFNFPGLNLWCGIPCSRYNQKLDFLFLPVYLESGLTSLELRKKVHTIKIVHQNEVNPRKRDRNNYIQIGQNEGQLFMFLGTNVTRYFKMIMNASFSHMFMCEKPASSQEYQDSFQAVEGCLYGVSLTLQLAETRDFSR